MQKFTIEELKERTPEEMISIILQMQQENADIAEKMAIWQANMYGRKTEKGLLPECEGQLGFFNEAEACANEIADEMVMDAGNLPKEKKPKRKVGDKQRSLKDLPVRQIFHELSEAELTQIFGENGWKRLPDQVHTTVARIPAVLEVQEHHTAVYASNKDDKIVRAPHPVELWPDSIATPSLLAYILDSKYRNHMPLNRLQHDFETEGLYIAKPTLANWVIRASERYLVLLWDRLKEELLSKNVIQTDETTCRVTKDGRPAGADSRMWVYRTGEYVKDAQIILYEYTKTRSAEHPEKFLAGFSGSLVCDGYAVYHKIGRERDDIQVANCWAHCRRHFANALKALKGKEKKRAPQTLAFRALKLIGNFYNEDEKAKDMSPEERLKHRHEKVEPLVEAYFAWVREHKDEVSPNSETGKGFDYSLNQEKYLKVFLSDGNVPIDNSATERAIRPFAVGRKNWQQFDSVYGAEASAVIYSIVETAKANRLNVYEYLKLLLTVIPEHASDTKLDFMEDLLPWSPNLPDSCKKRPSKNENEDED